MSIKKHKKKFAILLAIANFSGVVVADESVNLGTCSYADELKHGFDMTAYHQCITKFNQCPKNGPYLDVSCLQKKIDNESSCKQLSLLAKQINASPELIHVEQQAGFTVFEVVFPADSGHQYSLLSPTGCLIDTVVDPRDLSPAVRKQYAKTDFYLEAKEKPRYAQLPDGTQQFTIKIQARNQCRACALIGTATLAFDFAKNGEWKKTELLSFVTSNNA